LLRLLYFLHATGVANAILWFFLFLIASLILFILWYGIVYAGDGYFEYTEIVTNVFWRCLAFAIMVYCWAIASFGLWKLLLHRFLPREWLSFPLFCFGIICFVFYCVASAAFYMSSEAISMMFAIFPIFIVGEQGVMVQYFLGILGMIFMTALSAPMIGNACLALSPYNAPKVLSEAELQEITQSAESSTSPSLNL
jgi:hypothetical protein